MARPWTICSSSLYSRLKRHEQEWREQLEGRHFILVQDGDPSKRLNIPPWLDFELYNRDDIKRALGIPLVMSTVSP